MKKNRRYLAWIAVAVAIAVILILIPLVSSRRVTPILMYHAIGDAEDNSLYVTPDNFKKQMKYLHDNGYSVVSLGYLTKSIKNGKKFLPKTVAITFDDGFRDNFIHAFPVLSRYRFPATIFIITGYIDNKDGYLTWDQVNLMRKNGIDIGGHTRNNVYLPSIKEEDKLLQEIKGCMEDIESNTKEVAEYFCYPLGGFNRKVKEIVKSSGYVSACTTNRGMYRDNRDVYELKRVKITNSDMNKPFHYAAKLSGLYNAFRSIKKGY